MTRVFIADDNEKVRNDLRVLFELTPSIEVFGEAENLEQLKKGLKEGITDVLILDLEFGEADEQNDRTMEEFSETYKAIRWVKERFPEIQIFILTMYGYAEARLAALNAGADNFFVKGRDMRGLLELINARAER
jgi:DNA-binding NarL/FixJ family response regulator